MELIAQQGEYLGITPKVAIALIRILSLNLQEWKWRGAKHSVWMRTRAGDAGAAGFARIKFCGFHIFSGSQNLNSVALQEAHAKTLQLGIQLAAYAPSPVRLLNIGGGLGVPYFPGERALEFPSWWEFAALMPEVMRQLPHAGLRLN